jgi:hypothetical protein
MSLGANNAQPIVSQAKATTLLHSCSARISSKRANAFRYSARGIEMPFSGNASVIEAKHWKRDDGHTASPYGAAPWTSESERARWHIESTGYSIAWSGDGTTGICRRPFPTRERADSYADAWNRQRALRVDAMAFERAGDTAQAAECRAAADALDSIIREAIKGL